MMPFPFDGLPTGLAEYLDEAVAIGTLAAAPRVDELLHLDLVRDAYAELAAREALGSELARVQDLARRLGY